MTIIAYNKGILASDTKLSSESAHWANCNKIKKVKGWLIGAAGGWDLTEAFMHRFDPVVIKGGQISLPSIPDRENDFGALMISPKGKIYYAESGGVIGTLKTKGFIAIGSGEKIAMAAMEMGATAIEAVKLCMKYDIYCGGRVQIFRLDKK